MMKKVRPKKGSVVLIPDNSKIKSKWRIGRVVEVIRGRDKVVRGYKIKTGTGYVIEMPLQLVCDLEISGSTDEPVTECRTDNSTDANACGRPSWKPKTAAVDKILGITHIRKRSKGTMKKKNTRNNKAASRRFIGERV